MTDPGRVFAALADPRRRELLELLAGTPGASAGALAARLPVSRQAVAQHLAVLEECALVSRRRAGRQVLFSVRTGRPDGRGGLAAGRARPRGWPNKFRADQGKDPLLWWNVGCFKPALMWDIGHVAQIEPSADALSPNGCHSPRWPPGSTCPSVASSNCSATASCSPSPGRAAIAPSRPPSSHGDQIVKGLSGTLTVLFDCGFADEEALRWLFTADATLPGTPIDALNAHRGTEVNRRAQALAF